MINRRAKTFSSYPLIFILATLLSIIGLLATFSRAPIFALGFVFFVVGVLSKNLRILILISGVALTVILIFPKDIFRELVADDMSRRLAVMDIDNLNDKARFHSWLESLNAFQENPIFGGSSLASNQFELVTHNVPIRILGDFGLLGLLLYTSIWILIVRCALTISKTRETSSRCVGYTSLAACFTALADATFHSSGLLQRDVSQAAIIGACVGMCLNIASKELRSRRVAKA